MMILARSALGIMVHIVDFYCHRRQTLTLDGDGISNPPQIQKLVWYTNLGGSSLFSPPAHMRTLLTSRGSVKSHRSKSCQTFSAKRGHCLQPSPLILTQIKESSVEHYDDVQGRPLLNGMFDVVAIRCDAKYTTCIFKINMFNINSNET